MTETKRITALFSGGASSVKWLLDNDPNCGRMYRIVGGFSNKNDAAGVAICQSAGIPVEIIDFKNFCALQPDDLDKSSKRRRYFKAVSEAIEKFQSNLLMLSGFMLIVTEPLITEYAGRILNVHPADLTIVDGSGRRKYVGANAVRDALAAGETHTRSTVHLVTDDVDGGSIVALSDQLPVEKGVDFRTHQEKMKTACDGPAYARAIAKLCGPQQ